MKSVSAFSVLPGVVTGDEVRALLKLLNGTSLPFDADPDTVDGMATHEIFVEEGTRGRSRLGREASAQAAEAARRGMAKLDNDPEQLAARAPLRRALRRLMHPIIDERITPFVRARHPQACNRSADRACTPCYSLVRRYRPGERMTHAAHFDGHAVATVVVSLSEYGAEYEGGLYVATGRDDRMVLPLRRGDAVAVRDD